MKKSVFFSLLGAMAIWAMSFIWSKMALEVYSPIAVIFLRLIVSTVLIFLFLIISNQLQPIQKGDIKWFILLSVFEPFLYFIGENFGLQLISTTLASVIISTIPLFVPILAFFVLKERISVMNIIGIVISITGVLMMVVDKGFSLNAPLNGILLMGLAVFSATFYGLLLKHLSHRYSGYSIVAYQNIGGIVYFLPLFIFMEWDGVMVANHSFKALSAILLLAVFASTIAFVLYTHGVRLIGVTRSSAFVNLIPVLTAIFAWTLLDEVIGWQKIIGILIVISGLFASQYKRKTTDDVRSF
ncbi:MAG: DMT family transporter [Breznakibacter sp.]|nr:DMT family transporter [Breznakibacter sp.]